MNSTQRAKLAEAAMKATPGPYEMSTHRDLLCSDHAHENNGFVFGDDCPASEADAAYLSLCSPESILSLLALVEAGERCREAIHNVLGMAEGSANAIAYQLEQEEAGNIPKHTITKTAMAVWLRAHATDLKALEVALAAYPRETM